jgi:hypothetical protein
VTKTLPNLTHSDVSMWRLLMINIPAMICGVVLFLILSVVLAVWHTIIWLTSISDGISIYSHRGADNDKRK